MSRRREIARRLEALSDIAGIMSAMKGLALMEVRILGEVLGSQQRMVAGIEAAAADFLATHRAFLGPSERGREFCVLLGSEQGFCGDFNEALLARMQLLCDAQDAPQGWLVVGRRLAARIGKRDAVELQLPGATVVDEVPAVLLRLAAELSDLLARPERIGCGLSVLYHCAATGNIRLRRLLPLRDLPHAPGAHAFAADMNLAPEVFLRGLTAHYLHAALNEVLYSSLMAENRQREAHMDSALKRLDDDSARLRLSYNLQRQEDITEEIEVILLSADMLNEAEHGR